MAKSVYDQMLSSITKATGTQKGFVKAYEEKMPVINQSLDHLYEKLAGLGITGENLNAIAADLQKAVGSFQTLYTAAQEAVNLAGAAAAHLKEYEADPGIVADSLIDITTYIANFDGLCQADPTVAHHVLELAFEATRREALSRLSFAKLDGWRKDIEFVIREKTEK